MALTSNLMKGDPRLEPCALQDTSHITQGLSGAFVKKIQEALKQTDGAVIAPGELATSTYGPGTAAAVLKFKQKRGITNYAGALDNIVGKKTIAQLDKEMFAKERGASPPPDPDFPLISAANRGRTDALLKTIAEIQRLKNTYEPGVPEPDEPAVQALQRQLFVPLDSNFWNVTNTFLSFVQRNLATNADLIVDRSDPNFAHVDPTNQPSKGVTLGGPFFNANPNCRQEVVTHEFFHFIVGLQHFYSATTNAEAMQCPHHLARAVFDIAVGQQLAPCSESGSVCR